ncbi:MAG TPA: hypothetical protein VGY76_03595 [Solirubrobacteraceae bacterium]|nr:hypothetical protein [Solirubrobacteraceae bacterium]
MSESHLLKRRRLGRMSLLVGLALTIAALLGSASVPAAPSPPVPGVVRTGVSNVTFSSAVLYSYINPRGKATNYYFQYGKTSGYGAQTPLAPAGNGTIEVKVSQSVSGLEPATIYHFRLVATSSAGTTTSVDRTFVTPKIPLALQIAGVPNPVLFGDPFLVEGTLTGTGSANHAIVLQANLFPFTAGFKTVGNPELTNASGGFSFPVVGLGENAQLRVQTVGAPIVTSPVVLENVAVRVTFHARRTHGRGRWRLYGTVTPAEAGALVGFQRLVPGGRTVNAGGTVVKSGTATTSRFARTMRVRHKGLYRALVKIADGSHVSAYSAPVLIR